MVERYAALCEAWFLDSDEQYSTRLANYRPTGGRKIRPEEFRNPGPKLQALGDRRDGLFTETVSTRPDQRAVVWTGWVDDDSVHQAAGSGPPPPARFG